MQISAITLAEQMPAPGLLIIEAPTGEGKTEAALTAVEALARRFGADGVFVGMPTQATSDHMLTRFRRWASSVEPGLPIGLLHGKARFNKEWRELLTKRKVEFAGIDDYGCEDVYGTGPVSHRAPQDAKDTVAPSEWLLGRNRGLLIPLTVGTVDQLLHAATRTRHVMLRHAGLAGRVVVLDEVHAYDIYMAQFLFEALRWLADAGVPVILLSATLPPAMRAELVDAYLQGALGVRDVDLSALPAAGGYPSVLSACAVDGAPRFQVAGSRPWRESLDVAVEVLDEPGDGSPEPVVGLLRESLSDGGCALVVRNTVARAQRTYAAVEKAFGQDAVLLHARFTAGERADRTSRVLDLLGPPDREGAPPRPHRMVVVATQVAEQSFDVDVDLLVTDLAPIDLLLQRVGRLHRHDRREPRPAPVRSPRVVVTGLTRRDGQLPRFPLGSTFVYGEHLLLRTAALVLRAEVEGGWSVPAQVPDLVARGYGDTELVPAGWSEPASAAEAERARELRRRQAAAEPFLLAGPDRLGTSTLAGLHTLSTANLPDEDAVAAVVRDGPESVEVVLVRRDGRGYLTLDGRAMGVNGEAVSDSEIAERVVQASVRLPAGAELTDAAKRELRPLPGWQADSWLARSRALVLDEARSARLGGHLLRYEPDLGLIDERTP
ncbi:MAG TPA: CRISPR-associated helicase Cas3' [Mycobacteriales bacterium]|nr:CRISPR-associated helicase Cas3' [Mycobacteriales bacterium]